MHHFLVNKMSKLELQCTSIVLLLIVTIVGAVDDEACFDPPISNYSALIDCCQGSAITYSEEVMKLFSDEPKNSTSKKSPKELVLRKICEIHNYLNYSGVIDDDKKVQKEQLIDLIVDSLQNDGIKSLVRSSTDKCLRLVDSGETNQNNEDICTPYYAALMNCIQTDIFVNCPDTAKNTSHVCSDCHAFIAWCGVGTLQESYENSESVDSDSSSSSSESESYDSSDSSGSESDSSSDSDSDYEYETQTEQEQTTPMI